MKKILCCFGTRPEFIKMFPVINELKKSFCVKSVNTRQHQELLDGLMNHYKFTPDCTLDVMEKGQSLNELSSKILFNIDQVLKNDKYDLVVVQGDTTTAFCSSLAAFNNKIKVAHVEAGLRSNDKENPYPEEIYRRMITQISDINLCPNVSDIKNIKDSLSKYNYVVGNTVVDMLKYTIGLGDTNILNDLDITNNEYVLFTCHRRENHEKIEDICDCIELLSYKYKIVIPVHMNPNVRNIIIKRFSNNINIKLCESFDYPDMVTIMKNCKFIVSDSGGVQEEAPSFKKFVYVLRDFTERMESIELGYSKLVGNDKTRIMSAINDHKDIEIMSNPYGDGDTSIKIRKILEDIL